MYVLHLSFQIPHCSNTGFLILNSEGCRASLETKEVGVGVPRWEPCAIDHLN